MKTRFYTLQEKILDSITPVNTWEQLLSPEESARKLLPSFDNKKNRKLNLLHKQCDLNNWLDVDSSYLDFHKIRKQLIANKKSDVIQCLPDTDKSCKQAVDLICKYLMAKYPFMFVLKNDSICNKITGESFNLNTNKNYLEIAATLATEDFNILRKYATGKYHLVASATLFPVGWSLKQKIGYPIEELHRPVPKWSDKINKDKELKFADIVQNLFDKLVDDRVIERHGTFLQNFPDLFLNKVPSFKEPSLEDIEVTQGFRFQDILIRRERQSLMRLPETGDILFTVRTYIEPMINLDDEELISFSKEVKLWDKDNLNYKGVKCWGPVLERYTSVRTNINK